MEETAGETVGIAGEITRLIESTAAGDDAARDRLVELLYAELRCMAGSLMRGEARDHTLGATALVGETYLRLFRRFEEASGKAPLWADRRAFFAAASVAMRRVLVDHARAKKAQKRGGPAARRLRTVEIDAISAATSLDPADFLALDEAIQRLDEVDERAAMVTRLRFFGGRDIEAVAGLLGVSARTVKRDWEFARAWLSDQLAEENGV